MGPIAPLKLITYNVGNKSDDRVLDDLVRLCRRSPYLIGLNEVGDREQVLKRVAKETSFRLVRDDSQRSSSHIAALVSPKARYDGYRLLPISPATRVGKNTAGARKDGIAEAKYLLSVKLTIGGVRIVVGVIHFVPSAMRKGNVRTRELHNLQVKRAVDWLTSRRRHAFLIGDWNAEPDHDLLAAARRRCTLYGAPSHNRRAIDLMAVPKKMEATFRVNALEGYSSDHRPVEFVLVA